MHPEYDCEDCGVYHFAWSAHMAGARRDAERRVELRQLYADVHHTIERSGVAPEVAREVLDDISWHAATLRPDLTDPNTNPPTDTKGNP